MAIVSARAYEQSIIDALAISDPQLNTALGTPVRKIITAVAQEMASYNVDVNVSTTLYSIESVSGIELDYLVGQFGFTRHEARAARGSIRISRDNGDSVFQFAYGTYAYKPASQTSESIAFQTTTYQEMAQGVLSCDIGIVAVEAGSLGNVPADTITYLGLGTDYMYVTNPNPTTGGRDAETDEQLRQRFLTTVFRNVSGTKDHLLGLALAHAQVRRATLIGQESRYSEVVQAVKLEGDSSTTASPSEEKWGLDVERCLDTERRYWIRMVDTQELLSFGDYNVSNDGKVVTFHNRIDSNVIGPVNAGGSYALSHKGIVDVSITSNETGAVIPTSQYSVDTENGLINVNQDVTANVAWIVDYSYNFINDGDFITIEFDYFSKHNRGGIKTVDLFVDCLAPRNVTDIQYIDFMKLVTSENASSWQRVDGRNPEVGHLYVPLSYQPLYTSSGYISVGTSMVLYEDTHYKVIYDVTKTAGSARGMDAIELLGHIVGSGDDAAFQFDTVDMPAHQNIAGDDVPASGSNVPLIKDDTPIAIPYLHDYPVDDVQRLLDSQRIVTMDVQVHEAVHRYFVIYLTLMFSTFPKDSVIEDVKTNIMSWATSLTYGHTVQFSDIETVAANTSGVDNVRVSIRSDAGTKISTYTDINGSAPGAYGIIEVHRDGATVLHQYTNDFRLAENELFEVQDIITYAKSQQRWGA